MWRLLHMKAHQWLCRRLGHAFARWHTEDDGSLVCHRCKRIFDEEKQP